MPKLETSTYKLAHLQIHSGRYMARLSVVCLEDDPLPTRSFIVQHDTELVLGGEAVGLDRLVCWALKGPEASIEVVSDPKRSGYVTRLEFKENL